MLDVHAPHVARLYSDFHGAPTDVELYALIPPTPATQDVEAVTEIAAPMNREK